ncbi:hypothetical protein MBLNU13_g09717t1 [Cladosporium sp. NU13]
MAFYYDNRYGDILFSEHKFYAGNIHFPRESRPAMHEWALFSQLVSDLPNMYGDLYESFKAKGYDMNDPLWKRENMKEVRAARDRGDRSDRSIRPDLGHGGMARDAWGLLRDLGQPVRDRFDDSFFPDASGDRYLMEPRWQCNQHLMQSRRFSDSGHPVDSRARRRRRELEHKILPEIGPMDMRFLDPPPDELNFCPLAMMQDAGPLDTGLIEAMGDCNALTNHPTVIRDADLEVAGPPPLAGHRLGASYDGSCLPREYPAELYMRRQDRRPRRRRSLPNTSGFALPPGATADPRMPRDIGVEDHLMGSPETNTLLGARLLVDSGGTPMPDIGLQEPMLMPRRRRRWW